MRDQARNARADMVERLRRGGLRDERVLAAMATVPRERFIDRRHTGQAYLEQPLSIGSGQTISAPEMVAMMAAALQLNGDEHVLEVGGGTGYAAAVLAHCAEHVVTIERHRGLAERALETLAELGYRNIAVRHADGSHGAPDHGPFHGISVAAMVEEIPPELSEQLRPNGILVCPVGIAGTGDLVRMQHGNQERLTGVGFVPLLGGTAT